MRFLYFLVLLPLFVNAQVKQAKVIVGIVVDQMCYEYLYRFNDKFCDDGFKKLMNEGTNCRNTHYNYVPTYTGPGHASIYTGTTPSNHGIVANDWYDRSFGGTVNCVGDSMVQTVGSSSEDGLCSPHNLKTVTITDQLKMTYPNAKVISMSIKDRGAILPGGALSDGSYWYDYETGRFITSTFFKEKLPNWVDDFNNKKLADKYALQKWETIFPIVTYDESGPDDSPYEHLLRGKDKPTFPYDLKKMSEGKPDYELLISTPFANTLLMDFALSAIDAENLGADTQTDMLCISFSSPDYVGHAFGPYSVELEDVYLRLDLEIKRLLNVLEEKFGRDGFTLFLTADHAVVPVPQNLIDKKLPGGYVFLEENMNRLNHKLEEKFGSKLIDYYVNLNIYLNDPVIDSLKIDKNRVESFIVEELLKWEGVKSGFAAHKLRNNQEMNRWGKMVQNGYHPKESGDVIFTLESGYLAKSKDSEKARKGTSHGSAFNYDTHVPLLWYGCNIKTQEVMERVEITDIAATLVYMLNVQRPGAMIGEPIVDFFKD